MRGGADRARLPAVVRQPRSALPSPALYHVTTRGVNRYRIFIDDFDYADFRRLFLRVCVAEGWICHAYCLMPNHVHAIIDTQLERLSFGMHRVLGIHAQRFNQRHKRIGHVYQERFHTKLIRDDEHLGNACAYVFDNPVRAGLCAKPEDWPWSGSVGI